MGTKFLLPLLLILITLFVVVSCVKNKKMIIPREEEKKETSIRLVPDSIARIVAVSFNPSVYFNASNPSNHSPHRNILFGNNKIKNSFVIRDDSGTPAIYIYNYADNQGFLMVSADYQMQPILAFVERGEYKEDTVPAGLIQWGNCTIKSIEAVRAKLYDNSEAANAM
ncbi:Spi family protease inhibitor [Chitinophaga polysaccharea]|uniref:Spi family protease inhibitor n=1 Tax=Chitinophaga polysaccharea TaxID=1293035 RepID=UPI001159190E|nr:Spi family protease inhibitor [Chitinophaga polysaccharea]